jgi:hypothetical protein
VYVICDCSGVERRWGLYSYIAQLLPAHETPSQYGTIEARDVEDQDIITLGDICWRLFQVILVLILVCYIFYAYAMLVLFPQQLRNF